MSLQELPHRRFNPLTREWILVSPHRTQRPWQGQVEKAARPAAVQYDPACYLCPGNSRAGGHHNPPYEHTFVFDNDFAALLPNVPRESENVADLLVADSESGICRVICFSPRHDLTLARMELADIWRVVDVWTEQYRELRDRPDIGHVQIFENRGEMMGASNPHPHCQVWATASLPNEPAKEQAALAAYQEEHGKCLLCEYLRTEQARRERIVCSNDHFTALVPFWALWPFETMVLAHRHVGSLDDFTSEEADALADILKRLTIRYDNLFETDFPYSMGLHQAPTDGAAHPESHFHAHYYPPLLRSATVKKFMVGFEMLGTPQRDITAESAAQRLRDLSEQHYLSRQA